jgi:hypothetical protein
MLMCHISFNHSFIYVSLALTGQGGVFVVQTVQKIAHVYRETLLTIKLTALECSSAWEQTCICDVITRLTMRCCIHIFLQKLYFELIVPTAVAGLHLHATRCSNTLCHVS